MLSRLKGKPRSSTTISSDSAEDLATGSTPSTPTKKPPLPPLARLASSVSLSTTAAPLVPVRSTSPNRTKSSPVKHRPRSQTYSLPPSVVAEWSSQEARRRASGIEQALAKEREVPVDEEIAIETPKIDQDGKIVIGTATPPPETDQSLLVTTEDSTLLSSSRLRKYHRHFSNSQESGPCSND